MAGIGSSPTKAAAAAHGGTSPYDFALKGLSDAQRVSAEWLRGATWQLRPPTSVSGAYSMYADVLLDPKRCAGGKAIVVPDLSINVECQCQLDPKCFGCQFTSGRIPDYDSNGLVERVSNVCEPCLTAWCRQQNAEGRIFLVRRVAKKRPEVAEVPAMSAGDLKARLAANEELFGDWPR